MVLPSSVIPSDVIRDEIENENPSKAVSEAQNKITDLNQVKIGILNAFVQMFHLIFDQFIGRLNNDIFNFSLLTSHFVFPDSLSNSLNKSNCIFGNRQAIAFIFIHFYEIKSSDILKVSHCSTMA